MPSVLSWFSHVQLFATLWTVAHQAPLSMELFRQQYWSAKPFPSPGDLPDPRIEPVSPTPTDRLFTLALPGKPLWMILVPLKWPRELPSSFSLVGLWEKDNWSRKQFSPDTKSVLPWSWTFQSPEVWEKKLSAYKLFGVQRIFVIATQMGWVWHEWWVIISFCT